MHITLEPDRKSGFMTIRHHNGILQDRNIFVANEQSMTVVRYYESQSQS